MAAARGSGGHVLSGGAGSGRGAGGCLLRTVLLLLVPLLRLLPQGRRLVRGSQVLVRHNHLGHCRYSHSASGGFVFKVHSRAFGGAGAIGRWRCLASW